MKVGGLGEFESIRKAMQREEAKKSPADAASGRADAASRADDAVQISGTAKALGKLRQIPDVRQAEIDRVLKKMENGSLMTPEAVKESVARMLENLLSGRDSV